MKRRSFLKSAAGMSLAVPAAISGPEQAMANTPNIKNCLSVTWLGGATLLLSCGELNILTDPCFGEGEKAFEMGDPNEMFDLSKGPNVKYHRRLTPFRGLDLNKIDHVLLSHMHEDHFDQKAAQSLPDEIPIFVPTHDVDKLRSKGFRNFSSLNWGDQKTIKKGNVTVRLRTIRADHSENPEIARILGEGNGYWLEFRQGDWKKTVYWTGDTFPTEPVLEALRPLGSPDIFIPHLGGVGTTGSLGKISMGASEVQTFTSFLQPEKIVPLHHSTYELYLEPIHHCATALSGEFRGLDLISEGTVLNYF